MTDAGDARSVHKKQPENITIDLDIQVDDINSFVTHDLRECIGKGPMCQSCHMQIAGREDSVQSQRKSSELGYCGVRQAVTLTAQKPVSQDMNGNIQILYPLNQPDVV